MKYFYHYTVLMRKKWDATFSVSNIYTTNNKIKCIQSYGEFINSIQQELRCKEDEFTITSLTLLHEEP